MISFQKIIFRASRGKVLTHFDQQLFKIEDHDGHTKERAVYILVFQQGVYLKDKIQRICESFLGKIFALPEDGQGGAKSFLRVMKEVKDKIKNTFNLIDVTKIRMKEYLTDVQVMEEANDVSLSVFYLQFLRREKVILSHLNMLKRQGTVVQGYVWSPLSRDEYLEKFYGPEVSLIDASPQRSARNFNLQLE